MKRFLYSLLAIFMATIIVSSMAIGEENSSQYIQLEKGSKGEAVSQLQTRLKELGFYSISVDGDYGNGTVNALKAFEEYNGLEATGIATIELQEFIFSDEAKGIEIPDIEITSVGMRKSYGFYCLRPTFVNHTDSTISAITYMLKAYNTAGERLKYSSVLSIDDIIYYDDGNGGEDYTKEACTGEIAKLNIKVGGKVTLSYSNQIEVYSLFDDAMIDSVYIAITRYVTSDGLVVDIPENDQIWYGSNGKTVVVEYENNLEPAEKLTFEIEQKADSFTLGIDVAYISNFTAEAIGLPVGGTYVSYVHEESMAEAAGLKEGDIIVKIGDVWVYNNNTVLVAKGKMDELDSTPVIFYRRGQQCETSFSFT